MGKDSVAIGRQYEELAAEHLQGLGYQILARNVKCGRGELDIVAKRGGKIYFVEVKARQSGSMVLAREAVTYDKQRRLWSAAVAWLNKQGLNDAPCSFLLVAIENIESREPTIDVIEDFLLW